MTYLVVCRQGVDGGASQRVGSHREIVGFIVQPLALQMFVPLVWPGSLVPGLLYSQHAGLRVAL